MGQSFDIVVLGAGINGLCTAFHLLRRGVKNLAVVDQFPLKHGKGSSHGKSRITRSSYSSPKYVELIQIAHKEEWPRLSREAGQPLLHANPGCFFGPGAAQYLESLQAVPELQDEYRSLTPEEARRRFPMYTFADSPLVIEDHTCSVVAAEQTVSFLSDYVSQRATVLDETPVSSIRSGSSAVALESPQGEIECSQLVVTAGGWMGHLVPQLAPRLQVAHQDVGYFDIEGSEQFPVWVYCAGQGDSFYGLPSFGRPGAKMARHRTGSEGDSPDRPIPEELSSEAKADLELFLATQFSRPGRLVGYEACLYTNTVNEDFLLDHHPEDERIVLGSACSGHGFKFAPLTGRILAELTLDGKSSMPLFEKHRSAFRCSAHQAWNSAQS